jgi:nucleoside-diphosphate-sugar epimerase
MRICISGVSGFIGQEIANHLKGLNYDVVSIGRSNPSIEGISHFNVDVLEMDHLIDNQIGSCDVFVHCSFIMASSGNLDDINVLNDNIKLTNGIVNLAKNLDVKSFINISSMAVYPNIDGTYSEDSIVDTSHNNDCLYGLSKICAENIFNYFFQNKKGIPVTNLRISQVYGDRMNKDRTYYIMKDELEKDNKITVWGNGERVSNFVDVKRFIIC